MSLDILPLNALLNSDHNEEDIKHILLSFKTISSKHTPGSNDVQSFLHNKAIQYEKMDLSRTYLVMSTYQKKSFIAGYFSISPKPLIISKKDFSKLSKTLQKRLMGIGHKTDQKTYEIKAYLLGQLGKNYNVIAQKAKAATGNDILSLAYEKILEAHKLVGGRILYLECEDNEKIKNFYRGNGFRELKGFTSTNSLCLFVKKIENLSSY